MRVINDTSSQVYAQIFLARPLGRNPLAGPPIASGSIDPQSSRDFQVSDTTQVFVFVNALTEKPLAAFQRTVSSGQATVRVRVSDE